MNLPLDLLEQADHLSRRELKRPRQASLRRSTSTSYYALYHLLAADASALMLRNASDAARAQLQRSFSHDAMKHACGRFLQIPTSPALSLLIGGHVSDDLRRVCQSFVQLQQERHSADYDVNSNWDRPKAIEFVRTAREAFAAWGRVRKQPEANVFLLSFLLMKTFDSPR